MNKFVFLLIMTVLTTAFGMTTLAQNMNEDFRKNPPAPLAPVPFNIANPFETTLPNGLKIVIFEDKRLPLVSYRLAFRTGDTNDPKGNIGLTSAITAMLAEGTKTRTSKQTADEIERLGANVSASSTADNTVVAASALAIYSSNILELLADITLNPIFPENELKIFKQNTIENLKFQRSQAEFLADEQISRILYGAHPYGITSPTAADIEKLTPPTLQEFHRKIFVPGNATLIVVGDVSRQKLLEEIRERFGAWPAGKVEETKFPTPPVRSATTLTIVDRPGSAQSNIVLSNLAIDRNSPDFFPMLVMNQVLGAGASARLFMNLREDKGYTYGAYSSVDARRRAGSFEVSSEVRTPVTGDSLNEFFYELNRIRDEKVPEQEIRDAQNFLTGVFPIRAETQEGLTNLITAQQLFNLPDDYLQTYRERVSAVSADDIARVAKKYITPDKIAIVIVGDAGDILPQVGVYSTSVEIFDTEGAVQDIAKYARTSNAEPAGVGGKWELEIEAQGQKMPVSLNLIQEGDKVTGELSSMLGKGEISDGKVNGNKISATAKTTIQGQVAELSISGTVDGETMKGTLDTGFPGFPPLPFAGKRTGGENGTRAAPAGKEIANSIAGKWNIETNASGQPVSISIEFKQDGNKLSGTVNSDVSAGSVADGSVTGESVEATLIIDFQGQPLTVLLRAKLDSDGSMKGTLTPQIPGIGDLDFIGTKEK